MKWFITGGAGFIGSNTAGRMIREGDEVVVFDNLSRKGSESNLEWLKGFGKLEFIKGDIRSYDDIKSALEKHKDSDVVLHLAAQVAVTTSVINPREDFEINAMGSFNLLEAIRENKMSPIVLNASTNKVYGGLENLSVVEGTKRYSFKTLKFGVDEERNIDFHSPYGCSKGCADQYMIDYSRIYGIKTVNFRQSCIYGYRQFGVEDQGWVAWFIIATLTGKPITLYGNGKQVRDVLFVDDLVDAYVKAVENIDTAKGQTYNVGGGINNSISLIEFIDILNILLPKKMEFNSDDWRPGDQPIFICDISKMKSDLKWKPKTGVNRGVELLYNWVKDNLDLFR